MDRLSKFLCDPAKVIKYLAMLVVGVGVLVYVYYQAMGGADKEIETETSVLVSMDISIEADAFIFRDETTFLSGSGGELVTVVNDGERVSKGQLLANVYSDSENTVLQDEISRIQRRIDILESSATVGGFVISDLDKIDDDLKEIQKSFSYSASNGDLAGAIDGSSDFLVKLNKRDLIVNSDSDYTAELAELQARKLELQNQIQAVSSAVYAPQSGYFYSEADGYENTFDISLVDTIDLNNFDDFVNATENAQTSKNGYVKIVNSLIWKLVCRIDSDELSNVKTGRTYTLSFPENRGEKIDMELEKIVSETNSTSALLVFRCNRLPGDFDYKRFQKAEIVKSTIQGLSVPKKAERYVDGVQGVYVLVGDVVRYRAFTQIAEKDNYIIARFDNSDTAFEDEEVKTEKYKRLDLYDNIIIGKDLFDGKILG